MYNTGELARKAGCKAAAVRYYERLGLLDEPAFIDAGRPRYVNNHIQQLALILKARSLGFSLEDIRELLHVFDQKKDSSSENIAIILSQINEKIAELKILKDLINQIVPT
ncbi:MAG: hypothetical protein B0W54_15065 [Cellvibrio sp. 79]|nr:MAG: hypothetical protein B0W54_15065 [Cellvibrio sp. 79]